MKYSVSIAGSALFVSALSLSLVLFVGCSGATAPGTAPATNPDGTVDTDGGTGDGQDGGGTSSGEDGSTPSGTDAASPVFSDGTPTRTTCSSTLGMGLSPDHGRLDGTLVSIVPETGAHCSSDPQHLHLQVRMNGANYDIAVNLDGFEGEIDAPLPGIPFAEGWHPMNLDYVKDFNLHSTALNVTSPATIRSRVISQLANANHISVFGTGYPGSDGAHLIHRKLTDHDGALVINPLAPTAHVIAFRFSTDTF